MAIHRAPHDLGRSTGAPGNAFCEASCNKDGVPNEPVVEDFRSSRRPQVSDGRFTALLMIWVAAQIHVCVDRRCGGTHRWLCEGLGLCECVETRGVI